MCNCCFADLLQVITPCVGRACSHINSCCLAAWSALQSAGGLPRSCQPRYWREAQFWPPPFQDKCKLYEPMKVMVTKSTFAYTQAGLSLISTWAKSVCCPSHVWHAKGLVCSVRLGVQPSYNRASFLAFRLYAW